MNINDIQKTIEESINQYLNASYQNKIVAELRLRLLRTKPTSHTNSGYRHAIRECVLFINATTNFSVVALHNRIKKEIIRDTKAFTSSESTERTEFLQGRLESWYDTKELLERFFDVEQLAEKEFRNAIKLSLNERYGVARLGNLTKTTKEVHMNTQTKTTMDTLFNYNEAVISLSTNDIRNLVYAKKQLNNNYRIVIELGYDKYQVLFDSENGMYFFFELCEHDYIFMTRDELYTFVSGTKTFHDDIAQRFFDMNELSFVIERFLETDDEYILIARDALFCEE